MPFRSDESGNSGGTASGDAPDPRPSLFERFWAAPRVWRTVGLCSLIFALLGVGAGGAEAAVTALSTTQIGYMASSTSTRVAHVSPTGSLQVGGAVNVTNEAPAPTTNVILDADLTSVSADSEYTPMPKTDVHQYRSVTVYIYAWTTGVQECSAQSLDPGDTEIPVGSENSSAGAGEQLLIWTFDTPPPNLEVYCYNSSSSAMRYDVMVTGRTG